MATQWYYLQNDLELGPIPYSDLIELVHGEIIQEDDLVRPDWQDEWQRADSVVGLFYMARRLDTLKECATSEVDIEGSLETETPSLVTTTGRSRIWTIWPLSRLFPQPEFPSILPVMVEDTPGAVSPTVAFTAVDSPQFPQASSQSEPASRQSSENGQPELATPPSTLALESVASPHHDLDDQPVPGSTSNGEWSRTVASALEAANARDAALAKEREQELSRYRLRGVFQRVLGQIVHAISRPVTFLFGWIIGTGGVGARDRVATGLSTLDRWLPRPGILRVLFKLGSAIVAANLVAFGIMRWSDRQALRFPGSETSVDRIFPVIGACGPTEFAFLVFQAALMSGVAAYGLAAVLEANADD